MKEKKSSLRFKKREHSKIGIASTVIGVISWCIFIALSVYASTTNGNAEKIVGVIGILDTFFVLWGAMLAFKGLQEREVSYGFAIVGMILTGTLFVIYFSVYFIGIAVL